MKNESIYNSVRESYQLIRFSLSFTRTPFLFFNVHSSISKGRNWALQMLRYEGSFFCVGFYNEKLISIYKFYNGFNHERITYCRTFLSGFKFKFLLIPVTTEYKTKSSKL